MEEFRSKLCLVDLAGSERAHDTGLTGIGLEEGIAINQSLSALGLLVTPVAPVLSFVFGGFGLLDILAILAQVEKDQPEAFRTQKWFDLISHMISLRLFDSICILLTIAVSLWTQAMLGSIVQGRAGEL